MLSQGSNKESEVVIVSLLNHYRMTDNNNSGGLQWAWIFLAFFAGRSAKNELLYICRAHFLKLNKVGPNLIDSFNLMSFYVGLKECPGFEFMQA